MVARAEIEELVGRLAASPAPLVEEGLSGSGEAAAATWVDLQDDAVALAVGADGEARHDLAVGLLSAILDKAVLGASSNPISSEAFALILDAAPDELKAGIEDRSQGLGPRRRYLFRRVAAIPGPEGARWLGILGSGDQWMLSEVLNGIELGELPSWPDEEWADRLDALAALPTEPRQPFFAVAAATKVPLEAAPALVRLAMRHARDENDGLFQATANRLRELRRAGATSIDLFDWDAARERPELFRSLLELAGDAGARPALLAEAIGGGLLAGEDEGWWSEPLDRPTWADTFWVPDGVEPAGELRLPDGRVAGCDASWTVDGLKWTIDVSAGTFPVYVVFAQHLVEGRAPAVLELRLDESAEVEQWSLIRTPFGRVGYHAELALPSFGAPAAYYSDAVVEATDDYYSGPASTETCVTVDCGEHGTVVFCAVHDQEPLCRTWLGTAAGKPVAVVTDLGKLGLDLVTNPARPWR